MTKDNIGFPVYADSISCVIDDFVFCDYNEQFTVTFIGLHTRTQLRFEKIEKKSRKPRMYEYFHLSFISCNITYEWAVAWLVTANINRNVYKEKKRKEKAFI